MLFAHKVTAGQCQDRQRGHYHKCWTCSHNNALAAPTGQAKPKPIIPRLAGNGDATKREMRVG